MDKKLYKK